MKEKILKFILVSILLLVLLASDFILLGHGVAVAVYEELETQSMTTNVKNVEFDSYFLDNGNKTHSKQNNLTQEEILVLNINVKEQGVLNDAKIKIENANFEIQKEKIQNTYVKNINLETNEIELNQIIYGNNVTIELPIKFKKQTTFAEDYFEMENTISLTGIYKAESEKEVLGQIKTRMIWTEEVDIALSEEIEKYIDLGENGVLLQQKVVSEIIDDKLPRQNETLTLQVPEIEEKVPKSVVVLLNGNKLSEENVNYTKDTKSLVITSTSNGVWEKARNEYKVIYQYNDITFETKTIELNATLLTNIYTKGNLEKTDSQTIEISKTGNVVSISKAVSNSIYKGFMYANVENETTYKESNRIEISDIVSVENIEITKDQEVFLDENGNEFDANEVSLYKTTQISKATFQEIFGVDGILTIKDSNNNVLATINNETETDADGNITINYEGEVNNLKIETTKPIKQGELAINHIRAIKGNTGYTKGKLKTFVQFGTKIKVANGLLEEVAEARMILEDTKTEATVEISNKNLSTLQTNENVQLLVTLKSDSEQYDLYKNPKIEIILPQELNINVKNITQLNGQDELNIVNPKLGTNDNGEHVIELELQGEQTIFENQISGGLQISITADIEIDKTIASKDGEIRMNYTNENREGEVFVTTTNIKLNSKYGVLIVNRMSGYNDNQDIIENIDNKLVTGNLDMQAETKEATQEIAIVNNYENDITDVAIIGKIPNIGEEVINEETVKATFEAKLKEAISVEGKAAKIYYSEDANATKNSETWQEDLEISTAKAFKIELEGNQIEAGNVVKLSYQLEIPEGLEQNQSTYTNLALYYSYAGDSNITNSNILLKTEEVLPKESEILIETMETEEMTVEVSGVTNGKPFIDGQDIYEGQVIKYTVKVSNYSNEDIKNVHIEATHENVIFWDDVEYEHENSLTEQNEISTKYQENAEKEKEVLTIETLQAGNSIKLEYQVSVKEVQDENQILSGMLKVTADGLEEKAINFSESKILDGDLKLTLISGFYDDIDIYSTAGLPIEMNVKNITNEELKDVIVELPLPKELYFQPEEFEDDSAIENQNIQYIEYTKDKVARFKIEKIEPGETQTIYTQLIAERIASNLDSAEAYLSFRAYSNNQEYMSNQMHKTIYQSETEVTANLTSNIKSEYVSDKDELTFFANIENKGVIPINLTITDNVPFGAVVKEAYFLINGEKQNIEMKEEYYNIISEYITINAGEKIVLVINTVIDEKEIFENSITNYVTVQGFGVDITTNEITYKIKKQGQSTNPDDQTERYNITGTAWIDSNANGYKESSEAVLENIEVLLAEAKTGNIVTDDNGNKFLTRTNATGGYEFTNVKKGSYIVIFKYDKNQYRVTQYQKAGVAENLNSDVIGKTINLEGQNQMAAITGTLRIENKDLKNIDAGFIRNEKFDLKLDKYINKIIIQNGKGTKVTQYNKTQLAKLELDSKQLAGSTVIVEYNIQITNEGELAGYVNEIVDYMPSDLTFSSEMNKSWYQSSGGELRSKELSNEIINPGETKNATLTLVKTINQNNTGTTINTAELSMVSNDFSIEDIDSVPGNKVPNEDDMSTAELIISIRTGGVIIYIYLITSIAVVIGIGTYFIKKKVLSEEN